MKKISVMAMLVGSLLATASSGFSASYGRAVGGDWYSTNNTWTIGGVYQTSVPGASDTVTLISADETIQLFGSGPAVTVSAISIGSYDATFTKLVTLDLQTNFTTTGAIGIGSVGAANAGNGAMIVSNNSTVITTGTTVIGQTAQGSLTLNGGATFSNTNWRVDMGSQGTVTLNNGTLSMYNLLVMANGSRVDINGSSQLWILGNNLTTPGSPLLQYISSGWIYGNGISGNVQTAWDGSKTIVTAVPEPATIGLMLISCGALLWVRRYRRS